MASSFYDLTLADMILGGCGMVVTVIGVIAAHRQNTLVRHANQIAEKALKLAEEQGQVRVRLTVHPHIRVVEGDDREPIETHWLVVTVINDGVDADLVTAGLAMPGGTDVFRPVSSTPFPIRMNSKSRHELWFGWPDLRDWNRNFDEWLDQCTSVVALMADGTRVEIEDDPHVREWIQHILKLYEAERQAKRKPPAPA